MAYENNNFNNSGTSARRNTNTNSMVFFNKNQMMVVGFYNDYLALSFAEAEADEDGGRHFTPKEKRVRRLISKEQVANLLDAIDNEIIPKIREYKSGSFSESAMITFNRGVVIPLNQEAPSIIDIHIEGDGKTFTSCLRAHFGIGSDKIPKESVSYPFGTTTRVENYDPKTGECEVTEVDSQFILFKHILEEFIDGTTNAVSHSIASTTTGWRISETKSMVDSIAEKNGITRQYNRKAFVNANNPFGGSSVSEGPVTDDTFQEPLKMQEASSIDAMLSGGDMPF